MGVAGSNPVAPTNFHHIVSLNSADARSVGSAFCARTLRKHAGMRIALRMLYDRAVATVTDAPSAGSALPAPRPRAPDSPLIRLQRIALLAVLFVTSGWVAKQLAIPPANVAMLWLPSGVAVGALLLHGRWMWPGVLLGSLILNVSIGMSMGSGFTRTLTLAVFTASGATLQALVAATLLRARFGRRIDISRRNDVAVAIGLGIVIPVLISATIGNAALVILRGFPLQDVPANMAVWALGDAIGILTVAPFAMIGEGRRLRALWRGEPVRGLYGYIALGVGLGLALTLFAWINAREQVLATARSQFSVLTTANEEALRGRLARAAQSLDAASGLFTAGERVTWDEWAAYSEVIDIERAYPGIRDIGFIRNVPRAGLDAYRAETRRNGLPITELKRASPTGPHYVVTYIYPLEKNRAVLGLDITFDPKRKAAADQARDTGLAVVTLPVEFVQYRGPGYGFTMMRPVYSTGRPPQSVAARRAALLGWVYHPFPAERFFAGLTETQGEEFELRIRALDADNSWITVFDTAPASAGKAHRPAYTESRQIDAAGRVWSLEWHSTAAFERKVRSIEPLLVLLTGLTINLALAAVLGIVARREAIVTSEVRRATRDLTEANRLLLLTEATTHVGHWRYDIATGSLFWSDELYRIAGRDPARAINNTESLAYVHPNDQPATQRALAMAQRERRPFDARVRIRRDDGELRYLRYWTQVELDDDGNAIALFGVMQDITSETQARNLLLKARDTAQRESQARGAFLANLSHEIRTPMNGVIGFAELLLETELEADQRNYAQIIVESGTNMMALLNDVLDLSKIEAGHMELADEPIAIEELARSTIRMLMPSVRQRSVWLEVQIDPALPQRVRGDTLRLRQVLLNLIGNAVKFTEEGFVRLEVTRAGDAMRFAVIDSGPGIPPDRIADIFKSFVQLSGEALSGRGGTGLGLTISSSLVRLMGGTLKVNSRVGEGSVFHFTLPCVPAPDADADRSAAMPSAAGGKPSMPAARVLLAEDNEINQALMRATAARLGLEMDIASNGAEAVTRAVAAAESGDPYDLVLMDIQMPVLDGIGAAQRLRALGHGPDTLPIVALSANVYQSDIDACAAAGMQAHLAKPVRRDALERAIATWARPRATRAASPAPVLDPVPDSSAPPAALVERYRTRKAELADALHRFDLAAAEDPATVAALVADIHKFAGTAGHFGDDEAGDAARETERAMAEASPHERIILAHNLRERIETVSHGDAI